MMCWFYPTKMVLYWYLLCLNFGIYYGRVHNNNSDTSAELNIRQAHSGHYQSTFCPVTSIFNFKVDGYFRYPLDLFDPQLLKRYKAKLHVKSVSTESAQEFQSIIYNCTSGGPNEVKRPDQNHICSNVLHSKCPINSQILDEASKRSHNWLYNKKDHDSKHIPFLYRIWELIANPQETIRLTFFGGSAMAGSEGGGCYCTLQYDKKCDVFNHSSYLENHIGTDYECAWPIHFTRWIKSVSQATIETRYWMRGGSNFAFAANTIQNDFRDKDSFTSRDVIFFDYSMNEARSYFKVEQQYKQEVDLERTIRAVYDNVVDKSDINWPIIILTETWPYATGFDWKDPTLKSDHLVEYTKAYTKMASHYKLPIFSFKDALWSKVYRTKHSSHIITSLSFKRTHPLFYNHLYYADLFAALFQKELNRAYDFSAALLSRGQAIYDIPTILNNSKMVIPPPIVKFKDTAVCEASVPPLLDLVAMDYIDDDPRIKEQKRSKDLMIGSYFTTPSDAWKVYTDSKLKYGWIDEFPDGFNNLTVRGSVQSQPRSLNFRFTVPKDEFSKYSHIIIVQYLRNYKNAGRFEAQLCGQEGEFYNIEGDALWDGLDNTKDWRFNRVSLTAIEMIGTDQSNYDKEKCLKVLKNHTGKMKLDGTEAVLEFKHIPVKQCSNPNEIKSDHCQARSKKQKVKLLAVKICRKKV